MNYWIILERLVDIILEHRKGCIVEIEMGRSTSVLKKFAEQFHVKLYSCDINKQMLTLQGGDYHMVFIGKSLDFIKTFDDTPAIVLLDGWHGYETVIQEAEFFFDKMIKGGVMFLHDTFPKTEDKLVKHLCSTSYKVRQAFELKTDRDCFTWPYACGICETGLTMVIKREKDPPYWRK